MVPFVLWYLDIELSQPLVCLDLDLFDTLLSHYDIFLKFESLLKTVMASYFGSQFDGLLCNGTLVKTVVFCQLEFHCQIELLL